MHLQLKKTIETIISVNVTKLRNVNVHNDRLVRIYLNITILGLKKKNTMPSVVCLFLIT